MNTTTMALDALKFGHESLQHLNPRANGNTNGRDTDIESLAASIVAHGLIQPLTVTEDGYTIDGNRRLAALRLLAERAMFGVDGVARHDWPIAVVVHDGPRPEEISLAANTLRVALHPADAYTAFARLAADGLDAAAIAARFGEKPKAVAQILALGNLAPVIVEAWRAGRLGREADEKLRAECARLTAPPPEGEGWAWAAFEDDLPDGARWMWQKLKGAAKPTAEEKARLAELRAILRAADEGPLDDEEQRDAAADRGEEAEAEFDRIEETLRARAFGEKERAKAGCVLSIDHRGQLEIQTGIVRPDTAKKSKGAATPAAKKKAAARGDPFAVSQALEGRLGEQLTKAVAASLPATPHVALAAILAVHRSGGEGPLVSDIGRYSPDGGSFSVEFTTLVARDADALIEAGAAMAAVLVRLACRELGEPDSAARVLFAAMDQDVLRAELRRAFDPADYFASVPKALLLAAIGEAIHPDQAKALEKKKRDEIASFAITHVPQTGWLPPQLRAVAGCAGGADALTERAAIDLAMPASKPKAKSKAKGKAGAKMQSRLLPKMPAKGKAA